MKKLSLDPNLINYIYTYIADIYIYIYIYIIFSLQIQIGCLLNIYGKLFTFFFYLIALNKYL